MAEHKTLAEALAAFQAELPKLTKDEKAKVKGETKDGRAYDRSYGYADLAQVVETVLPVLGKHGLSVTASSTITADGSFVLEVSLLHESDQRETGFWPLPDPRRSGPQDIGSAMTYGRRYLTLALTGTYPGGEDDDGLKAQTAARESWDSAQPRASQAFDQHRRGVNHTDEPAAPKQPEKTSWTDDEIREMHNRIETVEIGKAVNGYDWMAARNLHTRKIPIPTDEPGAEPLLITATEALAYRIADSAVQPGVSPNDIVILQEYADVRGLTKVMVSESTTLGEELAMARDTAAVDPEADNSPGSAGSSNG